MGLGEFSSNKSILIDGASEWVNTGLVSNLGDNAGDWTISSWFKTTSAANQFIYSEGKDDLDQNIISVRTNASKAGLFVRNAAAASVSLASAANIDDDLWHYVVGTKIGNLYALYLDGGFEASATTALGSIPTEHTGIGALARQTQVAHFTGGMDETSIYNVGISASQVATDYNIGAPPDLAGRLGIRNWWRLGERASWDGTNFTFPDQVGSINGVSDNMEFADVVADTPPN